MANMPVAPVAKKGLTWSPQDNSLTLPGEEKKNLDQNCPLTSVLSSQFCSLVIWNRSIILYDSTRFYHCLKRNSGFKKYYLCAYVEFTAQIVGVCFSFTTMS